MPHRTLPSPAVQPQATLAAAARLMRRVLSRASVPELLFAALEDDQTTSGTTVSSVLERCDPFATLSGELLRKIEAQMEPCRFATGQALFRQGQRGAGLVVVTKGSGEIVVSGSGGRRHRIDRLGPGEVLGEMSLLTELPCSADVVATTPIAGLRLPEAAFHRLARDHPEIRVVLARLIATRLGRENRDALSDKTLHGYRIRRRLDRGGTSIVYEAEHASSGRRVALKMLSHRLIYDPDATRRFQQEASIAAQLEHPGICRIHERFEAFHTHFLVMEYCPGKTLRQLLASGGRLPTATVKSIVGQLAAALAYAHRAGIVHRDLKPANVMIGRGGRVKLLDFGVAKWIGGPSSDQQLYFAGTPHYMSPEQLAGSATDERSDIFSLGLVAFEMLSGRPLFSRDGLAAVIRDHARLCAGRLPVVPARLRDGELAGLLRAALAVNPADRRIDLDALAGWAGPRRLSPKRPRRK